jgi:hypothetical protein
VGTDLARLPSDRSPFLRNQWALRIENLCQHPQSLLFVAPDLYALTSGNGKTTWKRVARPARSAQLTFAT